MTEEQLRDDLICVANLVNNGSRVLELGCGDGQLLHHLSDHKNIDGRGIEISQSGVSNAVKNGLSVIQGDADCDLQFYPNDCFDYCISSQMLQATQNPKKVLLEMTRIAKQSIISIPNFAYWYNRYYLSFKGLMPVSGTLSYQWYETPNIHFSTIADFAKLCKDCGIIIEQQIYLKPNGKKLSPLAEMISANLFAEKCVFLISRGRNGS